MLKLLRAAVTISSLIVAARVLGVGTDRDLLVVSNAVLATLPLLIFGPIGEVFRSHHQHILSSCGASEVEGRVNGLLAVSLIVFVSVTAFVAASPRTFIGIFAPELYAIHALEGEKMLMLMSPLIMLNFLHTFGGLVLNTRGIYYPVELAGVVAGATGVPVVLLLAPHYGVYALVASQYLVSGILVVAFLIMIGVMSSRGATSRIDIRGGLSFVYASVPLYMSYVVGQVLIVIEKRVGSSMGVGQISTLDYAQKILSVPLGVVLSGISTVVAPRLAYVWAARAAKSFLDDTIGFCCLIFLALLPLCAFFWAPSGGKFLRILLGRKFLDGDIAEISVIISVLLLGLLGVVLYAISGQALIAKGSARIYAASSIATQVAAVLLNLTLSRNLGVNLVAISWSIAHVCGGLVLVVIATGCAWSRLVGEFSRIACIYGGTVGASFLWWWFVLDWNVVWQFAGGLCVLVFVQILMMTILDRRNVFGFLRSFSLVGK